MKAHAAFLATLLAAATTVAIAQNTSQSTAPSSNDDQMQQSQPVGGQNTSGQNDQNANPDAGQTMDNSRPQGSDEIAGQVSQAISDASVGGAVHVAVKGNRLILSGTVHDKSAKNQAEQIASSYATNNNLKLVNHIIADPEE